MTLFGTEEGMVYKPIEEFDLGPDSNHVYRSSNVQAPRMTGLVVKLFTWVLESRLFGTMLVNTLKKLNLIYKLVSYAVLKESPFYVPSYPWEDLKEQEVLSTQPGSSPAEQVQQVTHCLTSCSETGDNQPSFQRRTIQEYARAYTSGETTPLVVAERFIAAVRESSNSPLQMSFFIDYSPEDILRQATESTLRYKKGEPISILDGVPIAVKDEIDCMPYPTKGGTTWLHKLRTCTEDAGCVKHLRSCGAMIVGKTNMHEFGVGTSGINAHYGAPRNPYDPTKISGGSSSGSATVVSAGLCPAALGVDGGGSVRIPASLCGVVGLKPTFGRVSHSGVLPLNWTVGMIGVTAGTVEDSLTVYAAISGNLPSNRPTLQQPKVDFPVLKSTNGVSNIKIAKYGEWFNDCSDEIKKCCYQALEQLCKHYKWETMEVTIPDIETMRLAHYVTIGSEFNASMGPYLQKLNPAKLGWDTRVALCVYKSFTSKEYLNAQRIRNRQMHIHEEIFKKADVIVSPTTGVTAYPINDEACKYGEFDYINGAALVRYQIAGNFLGLPAISVPVGYDKWGMPIGLQFIGRPWSEPTLIHIAYAMQGLCNPSYKKPKVYYDVLKKE